MLEVCVDSFESCKNAVMGGAHRLELCSALSEGGLTPNLGLLKAVKKHFPNTPVFAMLRPNNKISYQLTDTEMEIILDDMSQFRENGVNGFVFGALTLNRQVDIGKCEQIIKHSDGLPVTFHRAFDMTIPSQKCENLGKINKCGFSRLLTSGFGETAELGLNNLVAVNEYVQEQAMNLQVMPGCGINVNNAEKILKSLKNCKEFHASAKTCVSEDMPIDESDTVAIKNEIYTYSFSVSDRRTVKRLVELGKQFL